MTRVFHLIKGLGRGGAEGLLLQGLRASDRARFTYGYGYFLPKKNDLVEELRSSGGKVYCFGAPSNVSILLAVPRVAKFLRDWEADLIHCHLPLAGAIGRAAGRIAGIPVVYTEHNRIENYHPIARWMDQKTWAWQRRVFAVSADVAESIRGKRLDKIVNTEILLNGVDEHHFDPARINPYSLREAMGIPTGIPTVGTVAVFRPQKRLDIWLDAARLIRERIPETRFIILGDGPLRMDLEAKAHELGIGDAVVFAGLTNDVRPALAAMDVYMMSSAFEGLPIALLEAMAMQRPIVATIVGGIPEAIEDGHAGRLIKPGQADALASAVIGLLAAPEERDRLGRNARARVKERFSIKAMTGHLESAYQEVLNGDKRRENSCTTSGALRSI